MDARRRELLGTAVRNALPRRARNWLRSPRRTLEWGVDNLRFALGHTESVELRPGWVVRAHPAAVRSAFAAPLVDPQQRAELDSFIRSCTPGMTLLDIGAHFGVFSLAALRYGGAGARVVAVDPSRVATNMLELHARLNAVTDRISVVTACAADADGVRDMLEVGVIADGYFIGAATGRPAKEVSQVRAVSIDGLCDELGVSPTHLKVDVEGDEMEVLAGAEGILSRERPLVFLELHNAMLRQRGRDPQAVIEMLRSRGFACVDSWGQPITSSTLQQGVTRVVAKTPPR